MAKGNLERRVGRTGTAYRLTVDVTPIDGGPRKRHRETVRGSRKQAERRLRELLTSVEAGNYIAPTGVTVRQLLEDRWLPAARLTVRPTTFAGYSYYCGGYILPHLGDVPLQRLTADAVEAWLTHLLERGGEGGRPLSARTARSAARILGRALEYAAKHGLVARNVVRLASVPVPARPELRVPTPDEVNLILDDLQVRAPWAVAPVLVALHTGARRSEVLGLQWGDLDLDRAVLHVRRAYHLCYVPGKKGQVSVREPKSASSARSIQLTRQTVLLLRTLRAEAEHRADLLGQPVTDTDWVFASPEGRPWRPSSLTCAFGRAAARVGLRGVHLHSLRHLHASLLLLLGTHAKVVQGRLGHANIGITLDLYSHLVDGLDRQAADAFEGALNGGARPALTA